MPANLVTSFIGERLPFVTTAIAQPVRGSAQARVLKLPYDGEGFRAVRIPTTDPHVMERALCPPGRPSRAASSLIGGFSRRSYSASFWRCSTAGRSSSTPG
jgi:hypothetical protein